MKIKKFLMIMVYFFKSKTSTLIRVYFFTSLRVFKSNYMLLSSSHDSSGECACSTPTAAVFLKFF